MKKRILAFFLAGMMAFSMAPTETFAAANTEENGRAEGRVSDAEDTLSDTEPLNELWNQQEEPENGGNAAQTEEEQESEEPLSLDEPSMEEDILKNWMPPMGGVEQPKVVEISEETAESLEIIEPQEAADGTLEYRSSVLGSKQYDSSWDVYSSNYIYNRLNENERKLWDALDLVARGYLHGTENAVRVAVQGEYYYAAQKGVSFTFMGVTYDRAADLFTMFSYSNPQYYFIGNGFLSNGSSMFPMIYDGFANGATRAAETAKVKAQIDTMEAQIAAGTTEVEKARIAHDLICKKIKYDHDYMKPVSKTPYHQTAYSVFCDDYTVCAGYTKAFTILMNGAGVDTLSVTSKEHAWNMICINDSWYNIDLTWDDLDGQYDMEVMYGYFNRSTAMITGKLDQNNYHQKESCYTGLLPTATQDSGATPTSIGTIGTPTKTAAEPQIKKVQASGKLLVNLSTDTSGADIYYTTDGSEPSSSATRSYYYTGDYFEVEHNDTVKAIAVKDTMWDSKVTSAKLTKSTYTVKFNTKGGNKISSRKVLYGNKVKKPANPKRSNYSFAGWYTSSGEKWDFSSKVTKDMTLTAKWKKVTTGKASIKKVTNVSGKKMKVTLKKVSGAKGYEFRYASNSKMKSAKRVTGKSTSRTIGSLKKGKTYYVQARAYKTDSKGKKIYGSWSGKKSVKIKK
ncbi:MAG: hypothetical protein HFH50_03345 [Lachnospiraceae bacterium]|jgi:uncharacterized repeat protein (TIGR02543 family)|nr:hypothetical protein [Lachnospiraceae bacterium]MCI9058893.1 hypothetical protein [Lachnospiraceae bacterium]